MGDTDAITVEDPKGIITEDTNTITVEDPKVITTEDTNTITVEDPKVITTDSVMNSTTQERINQASLVLADSNAHIQRLADVINNAYEELQRHALTKKFMESNLLDIKGHGREQCVANLMCTSVCDPSVYAVERTALREDCYCHVCHAGQYSLGGAQKMAFMRCTSTFCTNYEQSRHTLGIFCEKCYNGRFANEGDCLTCQGSQILSSSKSYAVGNAMLKAPVTTLPEIARTIVSYLPCTSCEGTGTVGRSLKTWLLALATGQENVVYCTNGTYKIKIEHVPNICAQDDNSQYPSPIYSIAINYDFGLDQLLDQGYGEWEYQRQVRFSLEKLLKPKWWSHCLGHSLFRILPAGYQFSLAQSHIIGGPRS